jgi:hypothetical protein
MDDNRMKDSKNIPHIPVLIIHHWEKKNNNKMHFGIIFNVFGPLYKIIYDFNMNERKNHFLNILMHTNQCFFFWRILFQKMQKRAFVIFKGFFSIFHDLIILFVTIEKKQGLPLNYLLGISTKVSLELVVK